MRLSTVALRVIVWSIVAAGLVALFAHSLDYGWQICLFAGLVGLQTVSLNLLIGYTGLFSVAHVGFLAIGAYVTAILTRTTGPSPGDLTEVPRIGMSLAQAAPISMLVCGFLGGILMLVLRRLRDDYFSLATLGFAFIVQQVLFNARYYTRGSLGISSIPPPTFAGYEVRSLFAFCLLVWIAVIIVCLLSTTLVRSSFGRALMAIRENESVLAVFGYRTTDYKVAISFVASAIAGLAGALLASSIGFVAPNDFTLLNSLILSAIVTAGGLASIEGSLLAALLWSLAQEGLRFVPGLEPDQVGQVRTLILGLALIALMFLRPQGLLGRYKI